MKCDKKGREGKGTDMDEPGRWLSGVLKAPRRVLTRALLVATTFSSAGRGMLVLEFLLVFDRQASE